MKIFTQGKSILAASLVLTAATAFATPKIGFVTYEGMNDDDELAAKAWFQNQPNSEIVPAANLAGIQVTEYPALWVMVDKNGVGQGTANNPMAPYVDALKAYVDNGGKLYLSNHATQLCPALGLTPDFAPTVFGDGDGGNGGDIWTLNAQLGFIFRPGSGHELEGQQGYYNNEDHEIYQGLTFELLNDYPHTSVAMIGPGQREDHNSLWDCNIPGKGAEIDVIKNFENTYNAKVLATWGHVQDHCVAGLVHFNKGVIANGLAAYEFNQNSGANPYQGNIEKLTSNILSFLTKDVDFSGVKAVESAEAEAEALYYNLQGVQVANPANGIFVEVRGGKATKVVK